MGAGVALEILADRAAYATCVYRATALTAANDDWHGGVMNGAVRLLRRGVPLPIFSLRMTTLDE